MTPEKPTISEEAAQWAVRIHLGTLTPEEHCKLDAWVAADVRHEGALARARAAWVGLDRLAALGAGRAQPAGPPHGSTTSQPLPRRTTFFSSSRLWIPLVAGLGVVSLLASLWISTHTPENTYISGIGELRKVPLTDGSTMLLNTSTRASIHFEDDQRIVRLASGEALFEVAKDPSRPFVVDAGGVKVTAIGTAFAVRKESDGLVDVTVTEGVVEIEHPGAAQPVQRVSANERVMVSDSQPIRIEQSPPREAERRLAWRTGMIAFDGEPLSAAVAEFNRYSLRRIVIDDPALAARPITGIFRTTDVEEFARTAATVLNADTLIEGETIHIRPR